ncbi:sulfate transporter 3.1-like isoform X2 [Nymphaea colorata]|uniref:sulfate transporter 3.1-like isoform X2 n=1 Tax=Nymphaea colorata TaxID=210225 RepID=UPI00129EB23A|nr:sulfate transporter 3.1-like isoform X2 [Nymphaea colorata]
MGNVGHMDLTHRVSVPPPEPFFQAMKASVKEMFFPDDPFRRFKGQSARRRAVLAFQYVFPIMEWAPTYTKEFLKSDLIAGITIASLAIPQGISYAKLTNLPPIYGLYSSFVPPLIYAIMGSSRDVAIGTVAVASLLMASMLGKEVSAAAQPGLYIHLAFTSTFFAGVFMAALGFLRLGFIVDFLSHATIVGFMAGAATVVSLQQLKGMLGLQHFTNETDLLDVLRSVFSQSHNWRWQSAVFGCFILIFLLLSRHIIGSLKRGVNPPSVSELTFSTQYLGLTVKTGIMTGIVALAEGMAVGRSFAMFKNYQIDGNKEMIAFGMMNIVGSCTSCYITTAPFSRSAVNFNAGCKTATSNIVMATAVMVTLLLLTPLFYYTPLVVLSAIITAAMLGLIDYKAAIHLWKVDKADFIVCIVAFLGVVLRSVEVGLIIAVAISVLRLVLFIARPRTSVLGKITDSVGIYRSVSQYPTATRIPGILVLQIDSPMYFANAGYLRERILRWMDEEEDRLKASEEDTLQYVILDMTAVGGIDTSGISLLQETRRNMERRGLKLALANPGTDVMVKLVKSEFVDSLGQEWIFLTVEEAVDACKFMFHTYKSDIPNLTTMDIIDAQANV